MLRKALRMPGAVGSRCLLQGNRQGTVQPPVVFRALLRLRRRCRAGGLRQGVLRRGTPVCCWRSWLKPWRIIPVPIAKLSEQRPIQPQASHGRAFQPSLGVEDGTGFAVDKRQCRFLSNFSALFQHQHMWTRVGSDSRFHGNGMFPEVRFKYGNRMQSKTLGAEGH